MERHFDAELRGLNAQALEMGHVVEQALDAVIAGLLHRDVTRLSEVHALEQRINQQHTALDETCLGLLARQAPLASSLRLVVAVIKMNTDLERMGDQSVNIAQNAEAYFVTSPDNQLGALPEMMQLMREMTRDALQALEHRDEQLAREVISRDDRADGLRDRIIAELLNSMAKSPERTPAAVQLMLIARHCERIADHATNIAEDVIFVVSGKDVRHGGMS